MEARERFKHSLVEIGYDGLLSTGWNAILTRQHINHARDGSGASETDVRRALQEMTGDYLLV